MNSHQEWACGSIVKVGFLCLRVVRKLSSRQCSHDPFPWELESLDGAKVYHFTPHRGLERII